MKKLENMLEHRLNEDKGVPYPDFERMWGRLEQENSTMTPLQLRMANGSGNRGRNWSKIAVVASFSVLIAAAPYMRQCIMIGIICSMGEEAFKQRWPKISDNN